MTGMLGKKHSAETKKLMSRKQKGRTFSSGTKKLLSISAKERYFNHPERNPNYIDGRSLNKPQYCPDFDFIKEEIKERDNYQCQNADCWKTGSQITVHHIDYDKLNCLWRNLITLCNSCNVRANYNRDYWQKLYESNT